MVEVRLHRQRERAKVPAGSSLGDGQLKRKKVAKEDLEGVELNAHLGICICDSLL